MALWAPDVGSPHPCPSRSGFLTAKIMPKHQLLRMEHCLQELEEEVGSALPFWWSQKLGGRHASILCKCRECQHLLLFMSSQFTTLLGL